MDFCGGISERNFVCLSEGIFERLYRWIHGNISVEILRGISIVLPTKIPKRIVKDFPKQS